MADNIPKRRRGSRDPIQRAGWVSTWQEQSSGGEGADVTLTKAAESGKTHFVTYITASTDHEQSEIGTTIPGAAIQIQLKDHTTVVWEAWFNDIGGNNPAHFSFPAPIQLTEGNAIHVFCDMTDSVVDASRVSVSFGGFTDDGRVD